MGIDTTRIVFAAHGADKAGWVPLRQAMVTRGQLTASIAELPPCTIGIEACTSAHPWARQFEAFGHTAKRMAPKLVSPVRMSGQRGKKDAADAADAAGICEAVKRSNRRFVPVKTEDQPSRLMVRWARKGAARSRVRPAALVADGLPCLAAMVASAGMHDRNVTSSGAAADRRPKIKAVNTIPGNPKTTLRDTCMALDFSQFGHRDLAGFQYRFNRRFNLGAMRRCLAVAAVRCKPFPERALRAAGTAAEPGTRWLISTRAHHALKA